MGIMVLPWWVEEANNVVIMMSRGDHFVLHLSTGMVSAGRLYLKALGYWVKSNYCSCCMVSNTKRKAQVKSLLYSVF